MTGLMSDADEKLREWPWQQYGSAVAVEDELIGYAANEGQAGNFVTAHNAVLAERDQARQALQRVKALRDRWNEITWDFEDAPACVGQQYELFSELSAALAGPVGVPAEQPEPQSCTETNTYNGPDGWILLRCENEQAGHDGDHSSLDGMVWWPVADPQED